MFGTRIFRVPHLPVLCVTSKHQRILWLTDFTIIVILRLLDFGKSLYPIIFRKRTAMAFATSIGKKLSAKWFDFAHDRRGELPKGFEVWIGITVAFPFGRRRGKDRSFGHIYLSGINDFSRGGGRIDFAGTARVKMRVGCQN